MCKESGVAVMSILKTMKVRDETKLTSRTQKVSPVCVEQAGDGSLQGERFAEVGQGEHGWRQRGD